jgi:hypothetical protein
VPTVLAIFAVLAWYLQTPRADAQGTADDILRAAHSLRCQFTSGVLAQLESLPPKRTEDSGTEAVFDAIDRYRGRARLVAARGANEVSVTVGDHVLTFTELSPSGNPHFTVVFARFRPGTKELLAGDSHYFHDPYGVTAVGQYYGSCRVLQ